MLELPGEELKSSQVIEICERYPAEPAELIQELKLKLQAYENALIRIRSALAWYSNLMPDRVLKKLQTFVIQALNEPEGK